MTYLPMEYTLKTPLNIWFNIKNLETKIVATHVDLLQIKL